MQNLPEVGKTYVSAAEPGLLIHVENVHEIDAEDDDPATFLVEGCEPADAGDMSAIGYEFTADEWREHRFTPSAHP